MPTLSKTTKHGNYIKNTVPGEPTITLSLGNAKLSHDILLWNIPAVTTCPNCDACKGSCYARKAEKLYPSVLPCRTRNYRATANRIVFRKRMVELIEHAIKHYGVKAVRVHESGDFYNAHYAWDWEEIARFVCMDMPDVRFFAYTKSPYKPASPWFNIVDSILPDGQINYGSHDYVIEQAKRWHVKICPYGLAKTTLTCGVECKICQTHGRVLFVQH